MNTLARVRSHNGGLAYLRLALALFALLALGGSACSKQPGGGSSTLNTGGSSSGGGSGSGGIVASGGSLVHLDRWFNGHRREHRGQRGH